jgi:hypothetical protein
LVGSRIKDRGTRANAKYTADSQHKARKRKRNKFAHKQDDVPSYIAGELT